MPFVKRTLLAGLTLLSLHSTLMAADPVSFRDARDALQREGAIVTISKATDRAQFVRYPQGASRLDASLSSGDQLDEFLVTYGAAFGVDDHRGQLQRSPQRTVNLASSLVEMQQTHLGLEVFAGVLKAHFDRNNSLYAVNGHYIDNLPAALPPADFSLDDAGDLALAVVGKHLQTQGREIPALSSELLREVWYHDGLLQNRAGEVHRAYELLISDPAGSVREFVYVDVQSGSFLNRITGIHEALDREVSESSLANVVWDESNGDPDPITAGWAGGTAQNVIDWQNEIDGSRETYNLFKSMTSGAYLSYDGSDAKMRTVNNDPGISCPNANWNGVSTNYCTGVTGDDTVAHEWGHAYTRFTSDLIYQWQSGALNESYSDIWGEVVDFLNARGTDSPAGLRSNSQCSDLGRNDAGAATENSLRWLSGEDDPAFGGAIRDMWYPECYSDPGEVTSAKYWCAGTDGGGVHTNSGVPNHAFALMVDGDPALGITALSWTKAAHLHWAAQNMLTAAGNFISHADALEASCTALTGVDLPALDVMAGASSLSGQMITAADCTEVTEIIAAVAFRTLPEQCQFLETPAPALCGGDNEQLNSLFTEDWESGSLPAGWTVGSRNVADPGDFAIPDWSVTSDQPDNAAGGFSVFGPNLVIGDCQGNDQSGVIWIKSPVIQLASDAQLLTFVHAISTEFQYDGGNIKISVNGGAQNLVPTGKFTFNPYNTNLAFSFQGNTNPLAGQSAFTGGDPPEIGLRWGQSQLSLSGLAGVGDSIQLIIELGSDGCNGNIGWYVDDIEIYDCDGPAPPGIFDDGFE